MLPKTFTYPYDPSGLQSSNKILNESHTITPANGKDFRLIVPKAAPYFERSMQIVHAATGTTLTKGIDWVPGHRFVAATETAPFLNIYGTILITNDSLSGTFQLTSYQTIGGEFTIDEQTALEILANKLLDPRLTTWDKIINPPVVFDALAHLHHAGQSLGYDALVASLKELVGKFDLESSRLMNAINAHLQNHANPHSTTLEQIGLERFREVNRSTLTEVTAGENNVNYVTPFGLHNKVSDLVDNIGTTSYEGDLPFYTGSTELFSTMADIILGNVAVVENATELTAQLAARESFAVVFNTWQRIAMSNNNLAGTPAELNSWAYNSATDMVNSTINSTSTVALSSPDQVTGDYTFEVEVSSTNSDDDYIGISLGFAQFDGKMRNLMLMRSATVAGADLVLGYDYGQPGAVVLARITGFSSFANGWAGYTGSVKVRARRVGSVIYITSTNPGGNYVPEISYDLNTRESTKVFAGAVNLGYSAFSQLGATWKTLRRSGANPPVAALHTQQLHLWDGTNYVISTTPLKDVLLRGRFYRNSNLSRVYFCPASGAPVKLTDDAANHVVATATKQRGRVVKVQSDGTTHVGNRLQLTDAEGSGGCSIRATASQLEFLNPAGQIMSYFDTAGKLQHTGMNSYSDIRLKEQLQVISHTGLFPYYTWIWTSHEVVPELLRGTRGYGVLAQDVKSRLPQFVSTDSNGFLTLDETRLSLYLSMVGHGLTESCKMRDIHTSK